MAHATAFVNLTVDPVDALRALYAYAADFKIAGGLLNCADRLTYKEAEQWWKSGKWQDGMKRYAVIANVYCPLVFSVIPDYPVSFYQVIRTNFDAYYGEGSVELALKNAKGKTTLPTAKPQAPAAPRKPMPSGIRKGPSAQRKPVPALPKAGNVVPRAQAVPVAEAKPQAPIAQRKPLPAIAQKNKKGLFKVGTRIVHNRCLGTIIAHESTRDVPSQKMVKGYRIRFDGEQATQWFPVEQIKHVAPEGK